MRIVWIDPNFFYLYPNSIQTGGVVQFWPFFLYFSIFFCCEWVFAGICFWYFPLPAGALDLRPWPFCRPGRKLTGPGTDPGTTQTVSNSALLYCFCRILFLYCYIFCFVYLYFDPGTDPSTINLDAFLLSFFFTALILTQSKLLSKPFLLRLFLWCFSVILCLYCLKSMMFWTPELLQLTTWAPSWFHRMT